MPLTEHEDWWADPAEFLVVPDADFRRAWADTPPIGRWYHTALRRPLIGRAHYDGTRDYPLPRKVIPQTECPDL